MHAFRALLGEVRFRFPGGADRRRTCITPLEGVSSVREEVEAAGFVLDAESTMLANKDDPHSIKAFDPSIKGKTDRFA